MSDIRVLMLDLGGTLVRENPLAVLPHVDQALTELAQIETAPGQLLELCLVSDFSMPDPSELPALPARIDGLFQEYLQILTDLGLKRLFEPVDRRVTLSTHVGVRKPDCRLFQVALLRLGLPVALSQCLFITEATDHILAARRMGMHALRFGSQPAPGVDFHDWKQAVKLVTNTVTGP